MHYYVAASDRNRQMGVVVLVASFKRNCGETAELRYRTARQVTYKLQDKSSAKNAQHKSVSKVLF